MRRIGIKAIAVICALSLVAASCGDSGSGSSGDGDGTTATTSGSETTAAPTDDTEAPDEATTTAGAPDDGGDDGMAPGGPLSVVSSFAVNSLNPHDDQTPATFAYYAWFYEGLVRQAVDGSIEPWLASDWETTNDGSTVTFTLNEGITFSDGTPFDADAVVANIEFVKSAAPEQVIPPVAGQLGMVDSVEALDATTVQFNLSGPGEVLLLSGLIRNSGFMVSPAALGDAAANPIGTGPYTFDADGSSVDLVEIAMLANATYWRPGEVGAESVTLTAIPDAQARLDSFNAGQYDIVVQNLGNVDLITTGAVQTAPTVRVGFVISDWLGETVPELANRDVRCAMGQALNRAGIQDASGAPGTELKQFATSPDDYAYVDDLDVPDFDIDAAKALFDGSGESGFTFSNGHLPSGVFSITSEAWAGGLNELGITMDNQNLDPPTGGEMFGSLATGKYPVQVIPYNEPNALMSLIARTGEAAFNPSGVSPDGVDELVASARSKNMVDGEADVAAAWKIMLEECVFILQSTFTSAVAVGDNVSGVQHTIGIPTHFWPQNVRIDG